MYLAIVADLAIPYYTGARFASVSKTYCKSVVPILMCLMFGNRDIIKQKHIS